MTRPILKAMLLTTGLLIGGQTAKLQAQTPFGQQQFGRVNQPVYSPYLNLLRSGSSPVNNYYGLVRPQIDFNQSIQNLQGQVTSNQQAINSATGSQLPFLTGHPVYFLNTSHYLQYYGGPVSSTSFMGAARPTTATTAATQGVPPARSRYSTPR
jgi:hypothetical protein